MVRMRAVVEVSCRRRRSHSYLAMVAVVLSAARLSAHRHAQALREEICARICCRKRGSLWRLRRACRWLKRGIIWSILWTGVGLCVMAPPYGSKEDEGQISPSETLRVAIRLLGGAWIGHVIAAILRVIALVTQGTIFETVIEAADWIAL